MKETGNNKDMLISSLPLEIQGYLIEGSIKHPIYQHDDEAEYFDSGSSKWETNYPKLSSVPTDPIPGKGTIVSRIANFNGNAMIYFSKMPKEAFQLLCSENEDFDNIAVEKIDDSTFAYYNYDPETFQEFDVDNYKVRHIGGEIKYKIGQDNILQTLFRNKLKREDVFQLKSHKLLPRPATYKYTEGVTYGVNTETAYSVGLTLGTKFTSSGEAKIPFVATAQFSLEVSAELSATFNHKTTITHEDSTSEEITFPGVHNKSYKYSEYSIALYQLKTTYTFEPGETLQKILDTGACLAKNSFEYNDSTTYLAVTPGAALSD